MGTAKSLKEYLHRVSQSEIKINISGRNIKLEYVSCDLCGSNKTKELYRTRDERFKTCDYQFSVVECKSCGLAYLNPRPDYVSMQAFYPEQFFKNRDDTEKALCKYEREFGKISRLSGRLLDMGCANGGFALYAEENGFKAEGLETADKARNPNALKIHKSFNEIPDSSFDVVTAWAVFEHLHDPKKYFKEIAHVLKKDGEFIFLVPNFASYRSKAMMYEDIPRHLFFYTPKIVNQYLNKAGLELDFIEQDNSIYYGGHRKFLVYLALKCINRSFLYRHRKNLWENYQMGVTPLWELIYLSPFEHLDRLVHRHITKWFVNKGMNGTMIVYARKRNE